MAAESLLVRQGVASGVSVSVVQLVDRRLGASTESQEWAFQREVEAALYDNGFAEQTGASCDQSRLRDRLLGFVACLTTFQHST